MKLNGYHIILVPPNTGKTRRLRLSGATLRLLVVGAALVVPLVVASLYATLRYQDKLSFLERKWAEDRQIVEQKEIVANRLMVLEKSLGNAEQSLTKLAGALDVELGQMEAGLGPVETGQSLSSNWREIPKPESYHDIAGEEVSYGTLRDEMNQFNQRLTGLLTKVDEVFELHQDKIRFLDATPDVMPLSGWITSGFGFRRSPYSGIFKMHYGIDIASPYGSLVKAPADGRVVFADFDSGYGRQVIVDHGYGLSTVFAHASELLVRPGDAVKRGDVIAAVGSSGAATGPHLHYEIHVDGIPQDPLSFVMK